jgi:WD40 repeat protein
VECAWSADGKSFVGATHDDKLLQWSLSGPNGSAAGGTTARLQGRKPAGEGFGPVFGPDGKVWALTSDMLAFGPVDGAGDQRRRFASEGLTWNMVRFSPDGKRLAIGVVDGSVRILDVARGEAVETIPYESPPDVTPWIGCLLWAPDGTWLAAGRLDGSSFLLRLDPTYPAKR